ncbi:MAG TPA: InlB B-repeat-containing protein [Spirochaetia bacterium]|nr:InlB B-repeat-containing protein [Spirochaetia bacterium]
MAAIGRNRNVPGVCLAALSLALVAGLCGCPDPAVVLDRLKDAQAGVTEHRVTYDANGAPGGTVPGDYGRYVRGDTVTVQGNTLSWYGRACTGWNTRADGSGTTYTEGQTFTMGTSDVILYAMWTVLPTYTVTYDANGPAAGSVPVDTTSYLQGEWVSVKGNSGGLANPPLGFDGWNTDAGGSGTLYNQGQTFKMGSSNVTLFATWVPAFTVTYDANGAASGSVPLDPMYYPQGHSVTALANTGGLARPDLAMRGWNTSADGTGTTRAAGSVFSMGSSNLTLYARWVPYCTLTYDANGATSGTVPAGPTVYAQGDTVTVLPNTGFLQKDGPWWTPGWKTDPGGSGHLYQSGDTFTITSDTRLYVYWMSFFP